MRTLIVLLLAFLAGCNNQSEENNSADTASAPASDTPSLTSKKKKLAKPLEIDLDTTSTKLKVYSNKRFKDVIVEPMGSGKFLITGKAQVFEASFNWKVEDGHDELLSGYTTTDAGAPEFGNFSFTISVKKKRENSTLTLILYEASANDGSPQHELHIPLSTN